MLLITPASLHIDRWLKHSARLASFIFCFFATGLFLFSLFYPWKSKGAPMGVEQTFLRGGKACFPYEAIGSGGLAIRARHALGWVSRLADELTLIAYNTRPDSDPREASILLSLKNGKQQLTLSNGSVLYLKESDQGKGLYSSEESTSLWVKPLLLENGAVLVEAGRKLDFKDGGTGEEKGQFIVMQQGSPMGRPSSSFATEIKSARCFVQDLLIQRYGGREYAEWKDKAVLEIAQEGKTYGCFVSAGDFLLFEDGVWKVAPLKNLKKEQPVACVKMISAKMLEIDVWDQEGFHPVQCKIAVCQPPRLQVKNEIMPSAIRLRNTTQISCALGKRRVILRQGDWLLRTPTGWRNLRKREEIEHYLHHRLKGELLVFDGIEKEQGVSKMKGYLFDETRTQMHSFALTIDAEKAEGKTSRKKRSALPSAVKRAT